MADSNCWSARARRLSRWHMSTLSYPDAVLHDVMRATAARHPDRVAIRDRDRTVTFEQFDRLSNRLAHGLRSLGLGPGDRLGLYMPNCLEYELAFYAASKLGAAVCPINPSYREFDLEYQVTDAGVRVLVTDATLWALVERTRARLTTVEAFIIVGHDAADRAGPVRGFASLMTDSSDQPPTATVRPDEIAALPYSSGTTGRPKGVMLTHRNL